MPQGPKVLNAAFQKRIDSGEVVQIANVGGMPVYADKQSAVTMTYAAKQSIAAGLPFGRDATIIMS
jgi:hypothetical protein